MLKKIYMYISFIKLLFNMPYLLNRKEKKYNITKKIQNEIIKNNKIKD